MAVLKGYLLTIPADYEGGVGGLLCWKMRLGTKQTKARMNSTSMRLKVCYLPKFLSSSDFVSYFPKTIPGIKIPIMRDTFRTKVRSWVTPALFSAWNQFADIFAWQFKIKGLPTPAIIWPTITQAKDWFTSILTPVPMRQRVDPTAMPALVP